MTKQQLQELPMLRLCLNHMRQRVTFLEKIRCTQKSPLYAPRRELLALYKSEADRLQGTLQSAEQAMNALPDELRELARLRYVDGLTIEQAAEQLYISTSTVKRMQQKALALLLV